MKCNPANLVTKLHSPSSREGEEIEVQVTLTAHPDDPDKGFLGVLAGTFISMEEIELPEGFNQDFEFELPGVPGDDA